MTKILLIPVTRFFGDEQLVDATLMKTSKVTGSQRKISTTIKDELPRVGVHLEKIQSNGRAREQRRDANGDEIEVQN